jgi:hypothetical protein
VWCASAAAILMVAMEIRQASVRLRRTCGVLVALTMGLLPLVEAPISVLERGMRIGAMIAALLLSIALLSRAAQRFSVLRDTVLFILNVSPAQRFPVLTAVSQLFGGFLGLAGITMMMEVMATVPMETAREKATSYSAISRGYAAANLWSPMYSNMSILLSLSPGLAWASVFPFALILAVISLMLGIFIGGFEQQGIARAHGKAGGGFSAYWQPLIRMAWPIVITMALFLVCVLSLSWMTRLPVAAVIIVMALCSAWIIHVLVSDEKFRRKQAASSMLNDFLSLKMMVGEIMLFLVSGCAGTVIASVIPEAWTVWISESLKPVPFLASLFLSSSVVLLSCTSVHPMLSSIVVAGGFSAASMGLTPTVHILSVLVGLGLAVIMTPFSMVSLMASRFSGLPLIEVSVRGHLVFAVTSLFLFAFLLANFESYFSTI